MRLTAFSSSSPPTAGFPCSARWPSCGVMPPGLGTRNEDVVVLLLDCLLQPVRDPFEFGGYGFEPEGNVVFSHRSRVIFP